MWRSSLSLPSAIANGFERNEYGFSTVTLLVAGVRMVRGIAMAFRNFCGTWDHMIANFAMEIVDVGVER
jgi:hypothetical protein